MEFGNINSFVFFFYLETPVCHVIGGACWKCSNIKEGRWSKILKIKESFLTQTHQGGEALCLMESILGLLRIRVKRGINLAVRDVRSSDPYVVIRMGNQVGFSFFFFFLISLAVLCSFFLFFLRLFFAFFWCCFFSEIGKFRNKKELVNLGLYFLI